MNRLVQLACLFLMLLSGSCQFYHDTAAKYNAYFLANEKMIETEYALFGLPQDNYNEILQVLVKLDSNQTKSQKAAFDYIISMASRPIQFHPNSKWTDDCYILVGKSRLYQQDYANALATFKFVNAKSDDAQARLQALILLLRMYVETGEQANFTVVNDAITQTKDTLNKDNTRDYHLVMAHYYRLKDKYEQTAEHLKIAAPLAIRKQERARYYYLLGQLFHKIGKEEQAFFYYQLTAKHNPNYDLAFNARLHASSVQILETPQDIKKAEKYYKKQLSEEKNFDFRDKIYYELAKFELRHRNTPKALDYLTESAKVSTTNKTQKAYSYLKIAEIQYDSLKNFEKAAIYYDSALQNLPTTLNDYPKIAEKATLLKNLASLLGQVRKQDRLLTLSKLTKDSLTALLEQEIKVEKEEIIKNKEYERLNAAKREKRPTVGAATADESGVWYFYSTTAKTAGRSKFLRTWGNRSLEDNWRRSLKPLATPAPENVAEATVAEATGKGSEIDNAFASVRSLEERIAEIPNNETTLDSAHKRLERALFGLGKIYFYQVKDYIAAKNSFDRILQETPESKLAPETAYMLCFLCIESKLCEQEYYKNLIIKQYPESFYAKIFINPDYVKESNQYEKKSQQLYQTAYDLYTNANYKKSLELVEEILTLYPQTNIKDKVAMLRVLNIGRTTTYAREYYAAINLFIQQNPDSQLIPFAQKLIDNITEEQKTSGIIKRE